jgi:diaminopimelate decarboxylase
MSSPIGGKIWKSVAELENRNGVLYFDGCDVRQLAQDFGTPLYVYSQNRIESNYRRVVEAYRSCYPNFQLYYAVKANNNPAIVKILADEGAGADACCIPEILIAKRAGIASEKILYSGVYNSNKDLKYAVDNHVRLNLEDPSQLDRVSGISVPDFLCFRINPGLGGSGVEGLVFAGPDAKFGIIERDVEKAYAKAKELGVKRFGIHMMTGSNILSPDYFEEIVEKLMDIAGPMSQRLGISFDFIDIGGSLGVPYRPEDQEIDIDDLARRVVNKLREKLDAYQMGEPQLIHELGRHLVSDAGILISQVTSIKNGYKKFIGLDAGMHTLLRPALYGAYHHILYANNLNAENDQVVNVVGQVCENTDIFAKDRALSSKISVDDLLVFLNAGAYGYCMSSQYNSQPKAAEVVVKNGQAALIRERETFEDIVRGAVPAKFENL